MKQLLLVGLFLSIASHAFDEDAYVKSELEWLRERFRTGWGIKASVAEALLRAESHRGGFATEKLSLEAEKKLWEGWREIVHEALVDSLAKNARPETVLENLRARSDLRPNLKMDYYAVMSWEIPTINKWIADKHPNMIPHALHAECNLRRTVGGHDLGPKGTKSTLADLLNDQGKRKALELYLVQAEAGALDPMAQFEKTPGYESGPLKNLNAVTNMLGIDPKSALEIMTKRLQQTSVAARIANWSANEFKGNDTHSFMAELTFNAELLLKDHPALLEELATAKEGSVLSRLRAAFSWDKDHLCAVRMARTAQQVMKKLAARVR